jgi:hypothetical protein
MIHDSRSITIALAITAVMLLMSLGLIAWAVEGMAAL